MLKRNGLIGVDKNCLVLVLDKKNKLKKGVS